MYLSPQIFEMKVKLSILFFLFIFFQGISQENEQMLETYPIFEACDDLPALRQKKCFSEQLKFLFFENLQVPISLKQSGKNAAINILFEVSEKGKFNIIYLDAGNLELRKEVKRVFNEFPEVKPATYNAMPVAMQFRLPVNLPISTEASEVVVEKQNFQVLEKPKEDEFAGIGDKIYSGQRLESNLNIPLSNELYSRFMDEVNYIGSDLHTASKPLIFQNVNPYYQFLEQRKILLKDKESWFGRKLWNEHLIEVRGEDYWFVADFGVDLQIGKEMESDYAFTYNNTRAAIFQGGLGEDLSFFTAVYESQGRFADYFNAYARTIKPDGGNPAIIPGRGIAKEFMNDGFDYPIATGYLSYSPSKFFNIQFGHGKNFIGDGNRSLFLSDIGSPSPYFKLNTSFWRLKYTNIWMSLRDVRPEVTADGSFLTKYVATHFLSLNVTRRLNIGLFESVIWYDDNNRGFDLNYLNPVIFYRAIEFSTGSRAGNALLGISGKYKFTNDFNIYSQLMIDEFSSLDIFSGDGSYKNKIGFQLGAKYFDAFSVEDLQFQIEYNQVKPYVYSHNTVILNYGHNNQSLAHPWGANFKELVGIARYKYLRWYASGKLVLGERGFDFVDDEINYGGNIFLSEDLRPQDDNHEIGQGNNAKSVFAELEAGYIVNPSTNLKLFGSLIYRNFDSAEATYFSEEQPSIWFNFGLRTDIFNWYFDY